MSIGIALAGVVLVIGSIVNDLNDHYDWGLCTSDCEIIEEEGNENGIN